MKTFKRTISVFLAALMLLGSISVFATIGDGQQRTLTSQVRFYREDANGDMIETTKVAKGESIEARIILQSDFIVGAHVLYYLYSKDVFEIDTSKQTDDTLITYDFDQRNGTIYWDDQNVALTNDMISNGYLDSSITDDFGSVYIYVDGGLSSVFDGIEEVYSVFFKVKEDAPDDAVGTMFIPPETRRVMRSTDPNFPHLYTYASRAVEETELGKDVGAFDGNNPQDWDADFEIYNLSSTNIETVAAAQGDDAATVEANTNVTYNIDKTTTSSYVTTANLYQVNYIIPANVYNPDLESSLVVWKQALETNNGLSGNRRRYYYSQYENDTEYIFEGLTPSVPGTWGVLQDIPEGYYFAGWTVCTGYDPDDPTYNPEEDDNVLGYMTTPAAIGATIEGEGYDYTAVHNTQRGGDPTPTTTMIADPNSAVLKPLTADNYGTTAFYEGEDGNGNPITAIDLVAVILPIPTEDVTVTWDATDINGAPIAIDSDTFAPGTEIGTTEHPVPTVPDVEGYDFVWYTDDAYTTEADFSAPVAINADTTYYGRYELQAYKLTVNYIDAEGNAIDGVETVVFDGDDAVAYGTVLADVVEIKDIAHYDYDADATTIPATMPAAETTVNVVYNIHTNSITYYSTEDASGEPLDTLTDIPYGGDIELTSEDDPTKENYEFKGWKFTYTEDGNVVTFNSTDDDFAQKTMPDAAVTATPIFEVIKSNITYKYVDDRGETIREDLVVEDVDAGSSVTVPDAPEIEYYTIAENGKPADFTMPAENIEKTYTYNRNEYTVTYEYKAGETDLSGKVADPEDPAQVKWDDEVPVPAAPEITGYGYQNTAYSVELTEGKMPKGDVTVTYNYEANKYTVTYKYVDGDGNAIKDADGNDIPATTVNDVAYGTQVTPDAAPEFTGYTISESPAAFEMPNEAVEKSYVYTINTHALKFVVDGEDYEVDNAKAWNTDITAPDVTAPEGKEFKGWYDNANCEGDPVSVAAKMPDNDLTYYGKFEALKYKLTVNYVDAEGNAIDGVEPAVFENDDAIAYGTVLADVVEIKDIAHYDYDADATTIPATMPATETTVNVVYNIHTNSISYYSTEDASGEPLDTLTDIAYGGEIEITSEDDPEKEGYDFAGWKFSYVDPDTGDTVTFNSTDDDFDTRTMPDAAVTATPIFEIKEYTLTIHDGDSSVITTVQVEYGATLEIPDTVTVTVPDGYHFTGTWEYYKEGETAAYTDGTMPAANVDAYAILDTNAYTIKFVTNVDGYTIPDIEAGYGDPIDAPAVDNAQNPGHAFAGWYYDNETFEQPFTTPFPTNMPNLGDDGAVKTLYAKWRDADTTFTINVYTMDTEGSYGEPEVKEGSGTTNETLLRDELLTQAGVTIGEGFELNETDTPADFLVPATNGVYNIYIDRVKKTYTVDLAGGTLAGDYTATGEYYYGAAITAPSADPEKEGNYDFDQWTFEGADAFPATMPANDVTATASYKHYTVFTFKEATDTEETKYDGETFTKDSYNGTVEDGYTFVGWSTTENDVPENAVTEFTASADVDAATYYPVFRAETFTVTYKLLNDGVTDATAKWADGTVDDIVKEFAVDAPITDIPEGMTRTGYKVESGIEWTGSAMSVPDYMPAENLTFYVNWIPEEYTITYMAKNAAGEYEVFDSFDGMEFGTDYEEWDYPADPEAPEGYELAFDLWNTDQNGNGQTPEQIGTMPANDLTFYAQYEVLSFNFRAYYVDENNDEVDIINTDIEYGQPTNKDTLTAPDREEDGWRFVEWDPALDTVPATMPAEDVAVQAVYEKITAKVTYKYQLADGTDIEGATEVEDVEYGTTVTPPDHDIEGYNIVTKPDEFVMGADDVEKIYVYEPKTYALTYKYVDEDGEAVLDAEGNAVADNETTAAYKAEVDTTAPEFAGYEYKETAIDPALGENNTMPAADSGVTVTYTYKRLSYTITYVTAEGATQIPQAEYKYMEAVTAPADPELEGNEFQGWYEDAEFNTPATVPAKMPAENLTFYAKFGEETITLTFKDGTEYAPVFADFEVKGDYGTEVGEVNAPAKDGYEFKGWYDNEQLNGDAVEIPENFPAADATFWAKYEPNQHNVTYIVDGNPVYDAQVDFGGDVAATKPADDPEKTGYMFTGWKDADGHAPDYYTSMPDNDLIFEAQFNTLNVYVEYIVDGETISMQAVPYSDGSVTVKTVEDVAVWHYNAEDGTEYAPGATYTFTEDDVNDGIKFYGTYEETGTVIATFDANGGYFDNDESITSKEVETDKGTVPVAPADPVQTGYEFKGWTPAVGSISEDTTYTAVWEAKPATVTYKDDEGNVIETFDQAYGEEIETPADPEKEGNKFIGWKYEDGEGNEYTGDTVPEFDLTATAQFEVLSYNFTVDLNEGSLADGATDPSGEYEYGADVPVVPEAEREGYEPDGWKYYSVIDGVETELDEAPATMPAYDVKAVAQWKIKTVTITLFYIDENSERVVIDTITQEYNTDVEQPADPNNREGYIFTGWAEEIPAKMPAEAKEIEALYSVLQFNITVDLDGGEYPEGTTDPAGEYDYGTEFPNFTAIRPTKEGNGFSGWEYYNHDTGEKLDSAPATMPAYDVDVVATWGVEKYEFIVDLNGGSLADGAEMPESPVEYGADVPALPEVEYEGYNLTGWKYYKVTTAEEEIDALPAQMPAYNIKAVAQWEKKDITLTFKDGSDSDKFDDFTREGKFSEAVDPAVEAPEKEGYQFIGWYDNEGLTGDAVTVPATYPSENATFWAKYEAKTYTIILYYVDDENNETVIDTITKEYNEDIDPVEDPTREGYTFTGWAEEIPATMGAYDEPGYTDNTKRIEALFSVNKYQFTYDLNEGSLADGATDPSGEIEYGADVPAVPEVEREGYNPTGWKYYSVIDGTETELDEAPVTMPAYEVKAVAQWEKKDITLTFKDGSDSDKFDDFTREGKFDEDVTPAVEAPEKEGYQFAGWYDNEELTGDAVTVPATYPAENATFYAKYEANDITLTFKDGSDTDKFDDFTRDGKFNENVDPAVEAPEKEGYQFIGWYDNEGLTGDAVTVPEKYPSADATFYAKYEAKKYNVTVDLDGGAFAAGIENPEGEYAYGAAFPEFPTAADSVTKADSEFSGWKYYSVIDGTETEISKPDTMPAYDVKAVAQYGDVEYTITFDSKGGTEVAPITAIHNADISSAYAGDPTKEGYSFGGWFTDEDCTAGNEYTVPATMPGESITVYAKWNAIVKLVAKEGTTTMVQRGNTVESYNDLTSVTINGTARQVIAVDKLTYNYDNSDCVDFYIYGLKTGISADGGLDEWVEVTGDGYYKVVEDTVAANGKVGTGTVVEVYDANDELIETLKVIIFGDVDGNGRINNADTVAVNSELTDARVWSNEELADTYDICKVIAADLDQNGLVNTDDYVAITDYQLKKVTISQVTGLYSAN